MDGRSSAAGLGDVAKGCKNSPVAGSSVRSNLHRAVIPSETCLSGLRKGMRQGTCVYAWYRTIRTIS